MNDSIALNGEFYASLARIALLDFAFGDDKAARKHILRARRVFQSKGMLTGQERLNEVFCELSLLLANAWTGYSVSMKDLQPVTSIPLDECGNAMPRDIECIIDDTVLLRRIVDARQSELTEIKEIRVRIRAFLESAKHLYMEVSGREYSEKEPSFTRGRVFHHVCIQTNKFEDSLRFYRDLLGAKLIKHNQPFHGRAHNAWLVLGGVKIELQTAKLDVANGMPHSLTKWNTMNAGPVHISVIVPDVQKAFEHMRESDLELEFKKKMVDGNAHELYTVGETGVPISIFKVYAPEGTEVEVRDDPRLGYPPIMVAWLAFVDNSVADR